MRIPALAALLALAASACASSAGSTPDNPIRVERPTQEEIMRNYPPSALSQRVTGRVLVECEVARDTYLDHCRVIEEDPQGYGFGDAAIQLAFKHHALPSNDGSVPIGRRVPFTINFTPPR